MGRRLGHGSVAGKVRSRASVGERCGIRQSTRNDVLLVLLLLVRLLLEWSRERSADWLGRLDRV